MFKKQQNYLIFIVSVTLYTSLITAETIPIITQFDVPYLEAFHDMKTIKDINCSTKANNILTAYACEGTTFVINSYDIYGVHSAKFIMHFKGYPKYLDLHQNKVAIYYSEGLLRFGAYNNYTHAFTIYNHTIDEKEKVLGIKIVDFKNDDDDYVMLITSDREKQALMPWKLSFVSIDGQDKFYQIALGNFNADIEVRDCMVVVNQNIDPTLYFLLSNDTILTYSVNYVSHQAILINTKHLAVSKKAHLTAQFSDGYLTLVNRTILQDDNANVTEVTIYNLHKNEDINTAICVFETNIQEKSQTLLTVYNDKLTFMVNNLEHSVQLFHLGNQNSNLFCSHIYSHNMLYEKTWEKTRIAMYQDDRTHVPVLLVDDASSSYPLFFLLCSPGNFFHPFYQRCMPCETNHMSPGGRFTHCSWCKGLLLELEQSVTPIDSIFTNDFFSFAETCYETMGSSSQCINCIHKAHTHNISLLNSNSANEEGITLQEYKPKESTLLVPYNDSGFAPTCKEECASNFLSILKEGPSTQKLLTMKCGLVEGCYDCNALDTCMWCNGKCDSIQSRTCIIPRMGGQDKSSIIDYLTTFESCPRLDICGDPGPFSDTTKEIRLTGDALAQNTVCTWGITLEESALEHPVSALTVNLRNFYNENYTKYVGFYLFHCYDTNGIRSCKFDTLAVGPDITSYTLRSTEFKVYMVVRENIPVNGTNLSIIYNKLGLDYYYIALFIIFWVMTMIVICVGLYVSAMFCKRFFVRFRRFRIIRRLRSGVIDEERDHLEIDLPASQAWRSMILNVKYSTPQVTDDEKGSSGGVIGGNEFDQTECCFCLETFQEEETLAKLYCKHIFHVKCFENWITLLPEQAHIKCPICARVIV